RRAMRLHDAGPRLTEEKVRSKSEVLPRPIPSEYQTFLLASNGGKPTPSGFKIPGLPASMSAAAVRFFFGIDMPEETESLEYIVEEYRDRIPPDFFPIATDPGD